MRRSISRSLMVVALLGGGVAAPVAAAAAPDTTTVASRPARYTVTGVQQKPVAGGYVPFTEPRLVDIGTEPVASDTTRTAQVEGDHLAPRHSAAVVIHLSLVASGRCFVTAWATGTARPTDPVAYANNPMTATDDQITVPAGQDGAVSFYVHCTTTLPDGNAAGLTIDATVDGYYRGGTPTAAGAFVPVPLTTVGDSRTGSPDSGPLGPFHQEGYVQVTGVAGVPVDAGAVLVNISAIAPSASGSLGVHLRGEDWADDLGALPQQVNIAYSGGHLQTSQYRLYRFGEADEVGVPRYVDLYSDRTTTVDYVVQVAGYFISTPDVPNHRRGTYLFTTAGFDSTGSTLDLRADGLSGTAEAAYLSYTTTGSTSGPSTIGFGASDVEVHVPAGGTVSGSVVVRVPPDGVIRLHRTGAAADLAGIAVGGVSEGIPLEPRHGLRWRNGPDAPPAGDYSGVSCTSRNFCVAVTDDGNALTFDGTSWSAPLPVDNHPYQPGNPPIYGPTGLNGVSCTSPTFCMAVGDAGVYTYDGRTWILRPTNFPIAPQDRGTWYFKDVDCVSATACVVLAHNIDCHWVDEGPAGWEYECVGYYAQGTATWDGTTWTPPHGGTLPTDPDDYDRGEFYCVSTSSCRITVDLGLFDNHRPSTAVWDGSSWTSGHDDLTAATCGQKYCDQIRSTKIFPMPDTRVTQMWCVSASWCYAEARGARSYVYSNSHWALLHQPPVDVYPYEDQDNEVTCGAPKFCLRINRRNSSPAVVLSPLGTAASAK